MKVLSFNVGYFLNYEGTHLDYLKNPGKSITGSRDEKDNLQDFVELVESEDPEFILLQEVDGGSIRTSTEGQHQYLSKELPQKYIYDFHTKYRGTFFPGVPIFRHLGNAVFFKRGRVENHSLGIGRKNLVQEIKLEDFSIFSVHLSTFGGWIRRKQLEQIRQIAVKRAGFVLAGDLNFHKGKKEIDHLEETFGTEVHSPGKTFPAKDPSQRLDLVASSEKLEIQGLEKLGNHFSDHRPILFDIERK
ncbi:MAG: endonuclease/exonuclease/phosphatase family protein [Candidatus Nanohaloarchaeota archaeon QJJ-7]|nr:endonuclease/exonuclease/phosphatase family protein [Candidatus Nanohaloarchaeota archaeon QJJ-7]